VHTILPRQLDREQDKLDKGLGSSRDFDNHMTYKYPLFLFVIRYVPVYN